MPRKKKEAPAVETKETKAVEAKATEATAAEPKTAEAAGEKKESPRAWLNVIGAQLHDTQKEGRTRVNVGRVTPEGETKQGYIFVGKSMVSEPARAKESNAKKDPKAQSFQVCLSKDKSYDFVQGFGENRTVEKISGRDLASENKAYCEAHAKAKAAEKSAEAPAKDAKGSKAAQAAARLGDIAADAPEADMEMGK